MQTLLLEPNTSTPGINFNEQTGTLEIKGESFPEDAVDVFDPVFKWIDEYIKNPLKSIVMDFQLSYFNTVSAKCFLHLMTRMEEIKDSRHNAKIRWFYDEDDEDSKEAGEEFDGIVDIEFEMIPINNEENSNAEDNFEDFLDEIM